MLPQKGRRRLRTRLSTRRVQARQGGGSHGEKSQQRSRVGPYEILKKIGEGGMGVVFKARHVGSGEEFALKKIKPDCLGNKISVQRFRNEIKAVKMLHHKSIMRIVENGEWQGQPYFVMRFMVARDLVPYISLYKKNLEEAAALVDRVAQAVQYAHNAKILHRDLKPSNILLDAQGWPFVTDFGLAKLKDRRTVLTQTHEVMGTFDYMAPEMAREGAKRATESADIYSLGAILFHLITGVSPRPPREMPRALNHRITDKLERICLRCLEENPRDRFETAGELAAQLKSYVAGPPLSERVLMLLAIGQSEESIARLLQKTEEAIKDEIRKLMKQLHVKDVPSLIRVALAAGMVGNGGAPLRIPSTEG